MNLTNILWLLPSVICVALVKEAANRSKPTQHIVGGTDAIPGQFPYFVSLQRIMYRKHYCGGTIISRLMVLTAAHCVCNDPEPTITIVAGINDLKLTHQGQFHYPHRYFPYPYYNPRNFNGDIALVQLQFPVWDTATVRTINIMSNEPTPDMKKKNEATVIGFGAKDSYIFTTDNLQHVNLPLWDRTKCNGNNFDLIKDTMICGGSADGKKSSCRGDSGGPVVMDDILIGVVSWGYECGEAGKPSVFAYVGYYRDWIRHVASV